MILQGSLEIAIPIEDYHEVDYLREKLKYLDKGFKVYEANSTVEEYGCYYAIAYIGKKPPKKLEKTLVHIASLK